MHSSPIRKDLNKLRVAYLVGEFPLISETFVYREIRALVELNIEVRLFFLRRNKSPENLNIEDIPTECSIYGNNYIYYVIYFFWLFIFRTKNLSKALKWLCSDIKNVSKPSNKVKLIVQFFAACFLARKLIDKKLNHLHIHFIHSPCQVGMYASCLSGIPYTVTAHANDIYSQGQLLYEKGTRAKRLITISEYNMRHFVSLGLKKEQVAVIRCIFDLPEKKNQPERSTSHFLIGSLGRMVPKKGFATLIKGFKKFLQSRTSKHSDVPILQLAGGGPEEASLKELVKELNLEQSVEFIGPLQPEKVYSWMRTLDCFALACEIGKDGDVDGIPVVLMEAMSNYLPAVSTNISGIPELIKNKKTGILVEPGDVDGLAKAFEFLLNDPDQANKIASSGSTFVQLEFSKSTNLDRLLDIFLQGL